MRSPRRCSLPAVPACRDAGGSGDFAVGGREARQRRVGVAPARIGDYPQFGWGVGRNLLTQLRSAVAEGGSVGGDPQNGDSARGVLPNHFVQFVPACDEFDDCQLVCARGRSLDKARDADSEIQQVVAVSRRKPGRGVDQMIGDAGAVERRPEPIAAGSEVSLHRNASQARIDADEQQPNPIGYQVGQRLTAEPLQLIAGEPHLIRRCPGPGSPSGSRSPRRRRPARRRATRTRWRRRSLRWFGRPPANRAR
ncbi:MAG: hypothetical protein JWP83_6135 [Mycobacterium sp.]|nr:hypothetical protein [Mycobacterium sp.]